MQIVNQLTAIPDVGFISANGEALFFSYNSPRGEVKAAQWAVKQGQLEYYDVELNRAFGIEGYQDCVAPSEALWRAEKRGLRVQPGGPRPPGNLPNRFGPGAAGLPAAPHSPAARARKSAGLRPVCSLNTREKYFSSRKPTAAATWATRASPLRSSVCAWAMRWRLR